MLAEIFRAIGVYVCLHMCVQAGNTALHVAARSGQHSIMILLLQHGSSIDARNHVSVIPAVLTGFPITFELFLSSCHSDPDSGHVHSPFFFILYMLTAGCGVDPNDQ